MADLTPVLVVNIGTASVKVRRLEGDTLVASRDLPAAAGRFDEAALSATSADLGAGVEAVGHRVVHGGTRFTGAVVVDREVETALRQLADLAPLHQAASLAGIDVVRRVLPGVPAVACFDTAFHAGLPTAAATYAVPRSWREDWGVRRYGFHGLSHAYCSRRTAELLARPAAELRVVTCHLGSGASLAAVAGGRSVDTTMGFTPLEGLVMATRSGSVDPGLVTWLLGRRGLEATAVEEALEHRSGLAALAGTPDMAAVLARAADGDGAAAEALAVYLHRLRAGVAAMAAAMGGLDVVAFTGGVGERAAAVRSGTADGLAFLGLALDRDANLAAAGDAEIGAAGAAVRAVVVTAREDLEIAREVRTLLGAPIGAGT